MRTLLYTVLYRAVQRTSPRSSVRIAALCSVRCPPHRPRGIEKKSRHHERAALRRRWPAAPVAARASIALRSFSG